MKIVEPAGSSFFSNETAWTIGSLILLLAWDAGGLDLTLARLAGGGQGFPLRDHWALATLLHQWPRQLASLAVLWLVAGVWWPTGVQRQLSRAGRLQWLGSALLGLLLVSLLKHSSKTSCPWDLAAFGGPADHLSHWAWGQRDGGPGHCFPAGHASAGFAFLGGYFALRPASARLAALCLAAVLSAGMVLGLSQQLRGAHFMSHTLWTGWLCWTSAWAMDRALKRAGAMTGPRPLA